MSGEPTKPKSAAEVPSAQRAASGKAQSAKAGSLPEAKSSASDEIAGLRHQGAARCVAACGGCEGPACSGSTPTMSRQPTWDMACALQADMFREAAALGSLDIRLVYYRGLNECRATGCISTARSWRS